MDTKESRKAVAKPSSIQDESIEKLSKPQHAYFALRQCDFLKGPAIFFAWEDCCFYVDQKENEGEVECQGFDMILDAIEWIHERAESTAGTGTGTGAASHVSRSSPATTNNGTTAKTTSWPSDDSKNNVLPTPSSATPSKATTAIKRQMRSPTCVPPNVSTQASNQTQLFPQVHAPFLPYPPFPMPPMVYPMMPPMTYPTMPPMMPPRIGYAAPYAKPMTLIQKACRTSLKTPTPQTKTLPKTAAGVGVDVPVALAETATPLRSEAMTIAAENSKKRKRPAVNPPNDVKWEEQFQEMARYKLKHGDCEISSKTASHRLKKWIKLNREEFAKMMEGKDTSLQAQRLAKLTKLGFSFTPKKPYPTWEERVEQYRAYKTKHGKVPVRNSGDGLGTWVALQRQRYRRFKKGEPSPLKQEQVDRLTEVGFNWDTGIKIPEFIHPRRSWDESYADLIAYKEKIGHTDVPHLYPRLGHWVHEQRRTHQKFLNGFGKPMAPERLAKLKTIAFVFSSKEFRRGAGKKLDRRPPKRKDCQSSSETEVDEDEESAPVRRSRTDPCCKAPAVGKGARGIRGPPWMSPQGPKHKLGAVWDGNLIEERRRYNDDEETGPKLSKLQR